MDSVILKDIIQNYSTPLYVFDINQMKQRIQYLRKNLSSKIFLCYAIKANTFVVSDMDKYIDRFEVCSPGEYQICKEKKINSEKVLISGVYKTPEVIKEMAIKDGVDTFSIESMEQFEMLKDIAKNTKIKVLIRITSGNQFGINKEDAEEIIKKRSEYHNLNIVGIQYFSGTQKKSIKNLSRELEFVDFFKEFSELINNMKFKGKIILELGRSIVASCGSYITKVVDKKTNKNQNYAILDGGIHHLVYFGQSMAMKLPICELYPPKENTDEKWNLCGSLCTVNDILVKQFPAGNLQLGDCFIFKNTGAYCMTEGISLFLSRDLPSVLKINENGKIEKVRDNLPTYKFNM